MRNLYYCGTSDDADMGLKSTMTAGFLKKKQGNRFQAEGNRLLIR